MLIPEQTGTGNGFWNEEWDLHVKKHFENDFIKVEFKNEFTNAEFILQFII